MSRTSDLSGVAASLACGAMVLSVLCYIVALARMPIADVIAILQTAPRILILAVAFLLRERVGVARVALALIGFAALFWSPSPDPPEFRQRLCSLSPRRHWARRAISSGVACRRAFR